MLQEFAFREYQRRRASPRPYQPVFTNPMHLDVKPLIGQVLHRPNTPKCSLKLIHRSRVGVHQSEVLPVGDSADIVCELGPGIGLFGLG